jgi:peptide/nickel transport system substrate-binding protein
LRFLKNRVALASIIGVMTLLVAACGSSSSSVPSGQGVGLRFGNVPYAANYQKPKSGGTIVFGDWQTPDSANVVSLLLNNDVVNADVLGAMWDSCVVQEPDISLGAASWHASLCTVVPSTANNGESADGTTTTIHIDPKAKWSDGQPITADDMLFYYNVYVDPAIGGNGSVPPWDKTKVTKVDAQTVQYNWGQPIAPYLLDILGFLPSHLYTNVYDPTTGKYNSTAAQALVQDPNFLNNPVSDGPYKIQSFGTGGAQVVMVPNPNYFSNYFHKPVTDKLIFQAAGTKDALIQAYKAGGTYTHVEDFTFADVPKFAGIPTDQVIQTPAFGYEHLEFNQRSVAPNAKLNGGTSIFADPAVRKAFMEGFNKCRILAGILGVACDDKTYKTDEFTAPIDPSYDPNTSLPTYSVSQSSADLTAAGYQLVGGKRMMKDGKTPMVLDIATTAGNLVRNSALTLEQADWETNLGVTVNLTESKAFFAPYDSGGLLVTGNWDISEFAFVSADDDDGISGEVQSNFIPGPTLKTGQNYSGINDPNLDSQLTAARQDLNPTNRIQDYKKILQELTNQYEFMPLFVRPNISLTATNLGNYSQTAASADNLWNVGDYFLQ